jgi:hypothetical protein
MAYTVTFSDGTKTPITIDSKSIDTTTSIGLWGQGYTNFGEIAATTLLNMLENFANATAPARPVEGQLWFDSSAKIMHYFDDTVAAGGNWKAIASLTVASIEPTSVGEQEGHFWLDSTTGDISIYYNAAWQFFASASASASINAPSAVTLTAATRIEADGTSIPSVVVNWTAPIDAVSGYEVQWTPAAGSMRSIAVNSDTTRYEIFGEEAGIALTVGVASVGSLAPSVDAVAPTDPTALAVAVDGLRFILTWVNPTDTDFDKISIRSGVTNTFGSSTVIGETAGTIFEHVGFNIGITQYYWIASVDRSGNTSAWVGPISNTITGFGAGHIADGSITAAKLEAASVGLSVSTTTIASGQSITSAYVANGSLTYVATGSETMFECSCDTAYTTGTTSGSGTVAIWSKLILYDVTSAAEVDSREIIVHTATDTGGSGVVAIPRYFVNGFAGSIVAGRTYTLTVYSKYVVSGMSISGSSTIQPTRLIFRAIV